jgi:AraC-like DNA-binding protein
MCGQNITPRLRQAQRKNSTVQAHGPLSRRARDASTTATKAPAPVTGKTQPLARSRRWPCATAPASTSITNPERRDDVHHRHAHRLVARAADEDAHAQVEAVEHSASMHAVAQELAMHRRTLDRRLQPFGIGFQQLGDEVRFEVAPRLLGDTAMPIIDIAHSLHCNDARAFSHAFRRWSGSSPTQWRERSGALDPQSSQPAR